MNESPSLEQQINVENTETKILRPSIIALFVVFLKVVIPVFFARCLVVYFSSPRISGKAEAWYLIFCLLWLLEMVRRYFNSIYYFTPTEIYHIRGRISFNLHRMHVKYADIRETRVVQSLLGRIFNYGTVTAGTAATAREELVCYRIDKPHLVSEFIQDMIKRSKRDLTQQNSEVYND